VKRGSSSASASPAPQPSALLGAQNLGLEGRVAANDHQALKVWLRLLSCSTQIETEIKKRLRQDFGMSLARFDYLAQLQRHPGGLSMSALSRFLMVTGGNVTGLTDELVKDGLVERVESTLDRRSYLVRLTRKGSKIFTAVAAVHESWVVEMFGGMGPAQNTQLLALLGRLRLQLSEMQSAPVQ
jgi:DNA-binding MarR family transcriptional regulator